jgi:hypothetical protein
MGKSKTLLSRERVQRHRDKLRAAGLRPVQIWVPDTKAPGFAAEAKRQSKLVGRSPESREAQEWIDLHGPLANEAE